MKFHNKKKRSFSSFVLLLISLVGFAQTTPVQNFHDTKGNIDVNGAGQLQFTLPIALPPGIKSVAPQVNLVHTNGSSNGIAGYDWNISGITSISRAGKNIEKDGEMRGIQLDYSDFYNFNGQRLILKSGEYGKDGAEYVTEKFSNTKIKSIGTITGQTWKGPEYWEVTYADGTQAWYGGIGSGVSNARTPLEYNIVKWEDPQGNYITYNYTQTTGTNVAVISSIKWGGNETLGKPHFNEIEFNYNVTTTRGLKEQSYLNGISLVQDKLLNTIAVKTNTSQFRKYDIIYKSDDTKYQFVEKIQEYNSENQPANPIEFYRNEEQSDSSYITDSSDLYNFILSGDFRGTHTTDFILNKSPLTGEDGYYLLYGGFSSTQHYLGTENVYNGAIPIIIKDTNNNVSSRQGFVSYSINSTTKDLTLSYYIIDLTKPVNALQLVGTKVIARNQWDESESDFSDPFNTYKKTSNITKLIQYDIEGDGVPEVLIAKKNTITNRICTAPENSLPTEDDCETFTHDEHKYIVVRQQDNSFPFFQFDFDKSENLLFGDFNGDGIDDIGKSVLTTSTTINGESVPANTLQTYNLKKDGQGNLSLSQVFSADYSGLSTHTQIGDFNGDGISDLFVRTNVNNHYIINLNTGKNFVKTAYFNDFNLTDGYTSSQNGSYSTAKLLDINSDGKSDIINFNTSYNIASPTSASSSFTIKVSENQGYSDGKIQFGANPAVTKNFPGPFIFREILGLWKNDLHIYSPTSNPNEGNIYYFSHYSNLQKSSINKIIQGGITTLITYDGGYGASWACQSCYKPIKNEQYPLMELGNINSKLVSQIYESGNQVNRYKQFRYRGLMINLHNKKTIGFRQMASSSWYNDNSWYPDDSEKNIKIWNGIEIDPLQEGAPVKEWLTRATNEDLKIFPTDISVNNTQLLSFKSTNYQTDKLLNGQVVTVIPDADKAKVVRMILPKTSKGKNFLTGAITESTVTYGEYYLPSQTVSKVNTSYAVTTSDYLYDNNPSGAGANYYIGRPKSNIKTVQAYSDSKGSKEEFTYENNLVKTIKNWNRDNTAYTLDTFTYDSFGNITKKVSGNSIDSGTITSGYEYDPKGRFVVKQTDNLGLQTGINYNDWGQITTKTDPFNNTTTNTYDGWGKLLTSTTNLGGTISYQYERDIKSNSIVTQSAPDGNVSKKYTNIWGQDYKTSTKAFGQGQFVSQETLFDFLGRKVKESEPYFEGQNASQWNIFAYDDTVYPAKVTATAFTGKQTTTSVSGLTTTVKEVNGYGRTTSKTADALGNIISTTDEGGTIKFSYNAAGEQTEAKYAENIVTTKYDSWGRKSEFNDPSNGVYKYEYDGFGRAKKTISPKGRKEYIYNNLGQLINQVELSSDGVSTIKNITFSYDGFGRITLKSGTSNGKSYSRGFGYDTFGRIISSIENSNGRIYIQNGILYDDRSRVTSYTKSLTSSGTVTEVTIMHKYNNWNGELYQLTDKKTGLILWELQGANAKGQVLKSKLGTSTINNTYDSNGFLTNINHSSAVKPNILQLSYSFDAIKNELKSRTTGGDFNIIESFDYDTNNRLINWTDPVTGVKPSGNRNTYDVKGRITQNDQVGTIKFGNSSKIYQPTGMTLNAAGTQNYNNDLIQVITYNENNDPVFVDGLKGDVNFEYGITSMRQRVSYGGNFEPGKIGKFTKLYSEDGSFEVIIDNNAKLEKHILYIGGTPYESNILYLKNYKDTSGSYKFLHKDYIGSILAVSDETGKKLEQRHFDAWGNLTHLQIGNGSIITGKSAVEEAIAKNGLITDRGYTSHEHFFEVGVIHMNGRLYDPLLRRFLNADENIQDPTNTQNYNKYGYVMNNPMMYNDPSGEFWGWFIGAIVGSYLSGVQANHGNWNPVKWDWKSTWGAVVGGAFAGAALGQGISNISVTGTKMIQNSVVGAVGSIFNGLANGQNIFKSALTGFTGINYSFNLSGNSITSTNMTGYSISEMLVNNDNTLNGATEVEFSMDTVMKVDQDRYKGQLIRGSYHKVDETSDLSPYLRKSGYSYGSKNNLIINGNGQEVWGVTEKVTHNGMVVKQRIYLPKGTFVSLEQLDLTMGHEIFHTILNNARIFDVEKITATNQRVKLHEYYTSRWEQQYIMFRKWERLNLNMGSFNTEIQTYDDLEPLMNKIKPIYNNYLKSTLK
ncbi:RHS repeat-associated core domain-containing protein [Chryseobacterium populi]|uniref:RHS repeat-associated core domain protein containing protein n=1 Tax=Chryseobacterium populi TaxID=1144316 RepID=J2KAC8_9FLAO|nr:RHS repeat-associated core domain-containing protein [Chryseobacterium populi]EJL70148.1 RHS repeat-associated core domain protein containing protein [Chryseobacterium populi]